MRVLVYAVITGNYIKKNLDHGQNELNITLFEIYACSCTNICMKIVKNVKMERKVNEFRIKQT